MLGSTAVCLLPLQEQLEREALCAAFPANYFHARQILQQPPTPNCPHLGHIERVPGPRSRWWARRRGSMLLVFLLLHNVVPGGNWRAPFPGNANDFPDEHRSEGEVRPFLGRSANCPVFWRSIPASVCSRRAPSTRCGARSERAYSSLSRKALWASLRSSWASPSSSSLVECSALDSSPSSLS